MIRVVCTVSALFALFATSVQALTGDDQSKVTVSAQMPHTTVEDGLRILIAFSVCRAGVCLNNSQIDVVRTLEETTFVLEREGSTQRVGPARSDQEDRAFETLALRLRPEGLQLMAPNEVESSGILLPWQGAHPRLVPGTVRVRLEGTLADYEGGRHPYTSDWLEFEVGAASDALLSLSTLSARMQNAPAVFFKQPDEPRYTPRLEFLGEGANGQRSFRRYFPVETNGGVLYEIVAVTPGGALASSSQSREFTCVAAGSRLETPDGRRAIELVKPGDLVLARALDEEQPRWTRVEHVVEHRAAEVLTLNGVWNLTREHPVAADGRFVEAGTLRVGDEVLTQGGLATIVSIALAQKPRPVYDLSVGEPHTFFVDGLLVHNKSIRDQSAQWLTYAPRSLNRPELERELEQRGQEIRGCVSSQREQAAVLVSLRREHAEVVVRAGSAGEGCLRRALDPIRARFPYSADMHVDWMFPLAEGKASGPAPTLDAPARTRWIKQHGRELAGCLQKLELPRATLRLWLSLHERDLSIDEVRDADGIPVDQRSEEQRRSFESCLRRSLDSARMPGIAPRSAESVYGELMLDLEHGQATWRERQR